MRGATFIGDPCKHGHGSERYAKSKMCVVCHREYMAAYNERRRLAAAAKRNPKQKALTVKTGRTRRYQELVQPPVIGDQPETVEQFLARGGMIQQVPVGATGLRP